MKIRLFILMSLILILTGCNESEMNQNSEEVKKNVIERMDLYMAIVSGEESCEKFPSLITREQAPVKFSSFNDFFTSAAAKYMPDFVMGKIMKFDCPSYLDEYPYLTDLSYTINNFELDESDEENIAKLYITMGAYEEDNDEQLLIDNIFVFKYIKDEWLLYEVIKED